MMTAVVRTLAFCLVTAALAAPGVMGADTTPSRYAIGNVTSLVIDRQDPAILYASSECAGIFKSTDTGATWHSIGPAKESVRALSIDPITPRTLYALTSFPAGVVFKSTDAGTTWQATGLPSHEPVSTLAIDPATTNTLFVGTYGTSEIDGRIYKSTDAGMTWLAMSLNLGSVGIGALAIDPLGSHAVYAGASDGRAYKSIDGGSTWSAANVSSEASIAALVIDPVTTSTVYATTYGSSIFKTTDAGATWDAVARQGIDLDRPSEETTRPTSGSSSVRSTPRSRAPPCSAASPRGRGPAGGSRGWAAACPPRLPRLPAVRCTRISTDSISMPLSPCRPAIARGSNISAATSCARRLPRRPSSGNPMGGSCSACAAPGATARVRFAFRPSSCSRNWRR